MALGCKMGNGGVVRGVLALSVLALALLDVASAANGSNNSVSTFTGSFLPPFLGLNARHFLPVKCGTRRRLISLTLLDHHPCSPHWNPGRSTGRRAAYGQCFGTEGVEEDSWRLHRLVHFVATDDPCVGARGQDFLHRCRTPPRPNSTSLMQSLLAQGWACQLGGAMIISAPRR